MGKHEGPQFQFKALTDLWTGSADGKHDRLITTGLLGSIRWWFEVLVRGLGGKACDPTDTKCEGRNHCVVCELFGCTGWARKFRFEVLDKDGKVKIKQIEKDDEFQLRFTPLRPIRFEERTLLDATLRLIAEYGAIGGKTVFKPTDEDGRQNERHHQDFGLIEVRDVEAPITSIEAIGVRNYVCDDRWRKPKNADFVWASLKQFWFVDGKALSREKVDESTFNKVLGRQEAKKQGQHLANRDDGTAKWLAGSQQESKKVFSFKNSPRTFGFVKPGLIDFDAMRTRLQNVWGKDGWELLTGKKIIDQLFAKGGDHS